MKYVRWIFVAILLFSLTAFINKGQSTSGLGVGNSAPDFSLTGLDDELCLKALRGHYVLLSFWASYDASARMNNALLDHTVKKLPQCIEMVSVSFDEYTSIFDETIKQDQLEDSHCYVETSGEASDLYKQYQLSKGFRSFLLDKQGLIIAVNVTAENLLDYID